MTGFSLLYLNRRGTSRRRDMDEPRPKKKKTVEPEQSPAERSPDNLTVMRMRRTTWLAGNLNNRRGPDTSPVQISSTRGAEIPNRRLRDRSGQTSRSGIYMSTPIDISSTNTTRPEKHMDIYCGDEERVEEVVIHRVDITNILEGREVGDKVVTLCLNLLQSKIEGDNELSSKFGLLNIQPSVSAIRTYYSRFSAGLTTNYTDFDTRRSLFEELWLIFHRPHIIVPIHHSDCQLYSVLEVVHQSGRIKLHIPVANDSLRMHKIRTEAYHLAFQVQTFMDSVETDIQGATQSNKGKRTQIYDEIDGEHQADMIDMSFAEQATSNFISRNNLSFDSFEIFEVTRCPKLKQLSDSGIYILHMIDSFVNDKRYSATAAMNFRSHILGTLMSFWITEE